VRSLYKVVGWLLVMEMEAFKTVVMMLVAEGRDGERKRKVLLAAKIRREG